MAIRKRTLAYIKRTSVTYEPTRAAHTFKQMKERVSFLWGDPVYVISTNGSKATISAKGHHFKIPTSHLMEEGVLSLWQIDCGQGDAGFLRFPNGTTMLIDGGPGPLMTNSPAQAPSFLYYMRYVDQSWRDEFDFQSGPFHIDGVVCSHPDYDHYGGFMDMTSRIRSGAFSFGNVYHNGVGRFNGTATEFSNGTGMSQLGPVNGTQDPDMYLTTLIDGFSDVNKYRTKRSRGWSLAGSYGQWLKDMLKLKGKGVGSLQRVHAGMGSLPDFDPGQDASIRVLGPVEESWKGKPALRFIDGSSKTSLKKPSLTRNGLSVVLRIDYGDVRLLMTGDLNFKSQALLLHHVPATEFRCHVAKACHHGSEDVSRTFLKAMGPYATLFSSGDNETHAHPRAKILGLAGNATDPILGSKKRKFLSLEEQEYRAPLIYSTELARSVALYEPTTLSKGGEVIRGATLESAGAGGRKGPTKKVDDWFLTPEIVYGLINVRTDGKKVVIGVMKEKQGAGFQTESFYV